MRRLVDAERRARDDRDRPAAADVGGELGGHVGAVGRRRPRAPTTATSARRARRAAAARAPRARSARPRAPAPAPRVRGRRARPATRRRPGRRSGCPSAGGRGRARAPGRRAQPRGDLGAEPSGVTLLSSRSCTASAPELGDQVERAGGLRARRSRLSATRASRSALGRPVIDGAPPACGEQQRVAGAQPERDVDLGARPGRSTPAQVGDRPGEPVHPGRPATGEPARRRPRRRPAGRGLGAAATARAAPGPGAWPLSRQPRRRSARPGAPAPRRPARGSPADDSRHGATGRLRSAGRQRRQVADDVDPVGDRAGHLGAVVAALRLAALQRLVRRRRRCSCRTGTGCRPAPPSPGPGA